MLENVTGGKPVKREIPECVEPGCTNRQRSAQRCKKHRDALSAAGLLPPPIPGGKSHTHGSSYGKCPDPRCVEAKRRVKSASKARRRQRIKEGTYTGGHGESCLSLGCTCPKAVDARDAVSRKKAEWRKKNRAETAKKSSGYRMTMRDPSNQAVTILHYPPRGEGLWTCEECGQVFPHRPLQDQPQQAA